MMGNLILIMTAAILQGYMLQYTSSVTLYNHHIIGQYHDYRYHYHNFTEEKKLRF